MVRKKKKRSVGRKRKRATPVNTRTARLNLMIRPDLKKWAHEYAKRRDKSLSSIINDHLYDLRERERGANVPQI